MYDILSLFRVLYPHLSMTMTQLRQFSCVVSGMLAMTGRVSMRNLSRWTPKGGSYRTIQRFFHTVLPWCAISWLFFRTFLFDPDSVYILAGDETIVTKSGENTYGVSRFFSSTYGKTVPGLSFLSLSLVSVKDRRSYPMVMEQIVRPDDAADPSADETPPVDPREGMPLAAPETRKRGRPKGSRNRNKREVELTGTLKQMQTMLKTLLEQMDDSIPVRYFVLDGYFGHNNALQMTQQCGMSLISKLRNNAALYFPPTDPSTGPGRPRLYGERLDPQQIDPKYRVSVEMTDTLKTEVYQMQLRHKTFPDPLNVVCILKTELSTHRTSHVYLFSSDLTLEAETMIDYYGLRFQLEFNFRDAKQYWGLEDFMNVKKTAVHTAANLAMFMVNVSAKLLSPFRSEFPEVSVSDLKARYRGEKYLSETLKMLPQKPDDFVIAEITEHLCSIGAIHQIPHQLNSS